MYKHCPTQESSKPAKQHPIAAMMNDSVMAGPVNSDATVPVMEKSPAPIITPTPRATRLTGPSTLFRVLLPEAFASACRASMLFLINSPIMF